MATVYILQSTRDGRFYIGSTTTFDTRWRHHKGGYTPSTQRMGQLHIVLAQEYPTLEEARYIEKRLKNLKRRGYIAKIVKEGIIRIRKGG